MLFAKSAQSVSPLLHKKKKVSNLFVPKMQCKKRNWKYFNVLSLRELKGIWKMELQWSWSMLNSMFHLAITFGAVIELTIDL